MNDLPTFSVIVPTYNRPAALAECLAALAGLSYPRDRFEVIVVDDGGAHDLGPTIERFTSRLNLTCLRQPNAGPSAARNTGVAAATGEFLAFTDDDCLARADWLQQLVDALRPDPTAAVGGVCINAFPDNLCCVTSQMILDVVNAHFNHDHERCVFFPSDNLAMSRAQFLELGGFDPAFRCAEDRDFCDRWTARGWRLVHRPLAVVDHARRMGLRGFCRQHFGYGRGAWRFHHARKVRRSGEFEVDGSFYLKCFREPWRTEPFWRAIVISDLLILWQIVNTAGFVYERFRRPTPAESPENAAETPARSQPLPAERASR